jgi:glutamine amidotransferase
MSAQTVEVVVIDFGMGNLRNVARALERAGGAPRITDDAAVVRAASRVVLPGVGAARDTMTALRRAGLDDAVRAHIAAGRPYLGLCVGMQVLLDEADEGGTDKCLGIIPGRVERFERLGDLPSIHMGWNLVKSVREHPVLVDDYFYFVHGYRAAGVPEAFCLARTDYGEAFPSAIGFGSCVAVQFHPEKSQRAGVELLRRFLAWSP